MRKAPLLAAGLFVAAALIGCDPPPQPKAPNPTRTLDERRAIEIIRRAVQSEGLQPALGRDEPLSNTDRTIRVDVGIEGKKFGLIYVSDEDAAVLGNAIQGPPAKGASQNIARVGQAADAICVLLYQSMYHYDDLVGAGHEQTTITAEGELARDVRDFITAARSRKFE
jgi:hypothetical protein